MKLYDIWVGPSEKGAYGFSDVMRANDLDNVIYKSHLASKINESF